jgi:hypothetical protein
MTVKSINPDMEKEARMLAAHHREGDPDITKVYWFPDDKEVRLLDLSEQIPIAMDGEVHPFYFPPSPEHGLPMPSAIAMIRPDEFGKLRLPAEWGDWSDAAEL